MSEKVLVIFGIPFVMVFFMIFSEIMKIIIAAIINTVLFFQDFIILVVFIIISYLVFVIINGLQISWVSVFDKSMDCFEKIYISLSIILTIFTSPLFLIIRLFNLLIVVFTPIVRVLIKLEIFNWISKLIKIFSDMFNSAVNIFDNFMIILENVVTLVSIIAGIVKFFFKIFMVPVKIVIYVVGFLVGC